MKMRAILWDDATRGMTFSYGPVPDELLATAQQWREKMVSAAAEASDELMDKYRKPVSWTRRRSSPACASAR